MAYAHQLKLKKRTKINLPGGIGWELRDVRVPSPNQTITDYALPWLYYTCGDDLYSNFTDTKEVNTSILQGFATTFVRRFYNREIGYGTPDVFAIKLRAFLDSELPVWGKFYRELIINDQAFNTSISELIGTSSQTGNGTSSTTSNNEGWTVSDGSNTSSGKTETSGNSTSDTENKSNSRAVNAMADTPQNQLNINANLTNSGIDDNPLGAYDFTYATQVTGSNQTGHDTSHSDNNQTGTSKTDDTANSHNESSFSNDATTQSKTTSGTEGNNKSNSTARNTTIAAIARELEGFSDGLYTDLFSKMLVKGLFMTVY